MFSNNLAITEAALRREGACEIGRRVASRGNLMDFLDLSRAPAVDSRQCAEENAMFEEHDVKVLNSLIATTIDSALGYEESADVVSNPQFSSEFRRYAQERRQVAETLRAEVRRLGGTPEEDGTIKAAAHRRWLDFRSAISGGSDEAVISEVRNGETYINEKYEAALKDDALSPETRAVIAQGYESVRAGHDRAVELKERMEHSADV
jgi:uncharacterized protein (TIGR02284 family)